MKKRSLGPPYLRHPGDSVCQLEEGVYLVFHRRHGLPPVLAVLNDVRLFERRLDSRHKAARRQVVEERL